MNKTAKILVLGARGMVGSSLVRALQNQGFTNILSPARQELDLTQQLTTMNYFESHRPEIVLMAAAKVGGIVANNTYRADFIQDNLRIQTNVFEAALKFKTERLLFLGSSCIYPRECPQPIKEDYLLTGPLEWTNEPYAIAKIAGLKTVQAFRQQFGLKWFSVMPTNLYGPNDNYDPETSHVIPGLMGRMIEAKKRNDPVFKVWGTGKPRREFMYVDDLAEACLFLLEKFEPKDNQDWINAGVGSDVTIHELAHLLAEVVGFKGEIQFDVSRPDGTLRKCLDVTRIKNLGWSAKTGLREGLEKTYRDFSLNKND